MKTLMISVITTLLIITKSCGNAFQNDMAKTGDDTDAISNAILDFSNTSKLYVKDSIYSVSHEDILQLVENPKEDGSYKMINAIAYQGITTVTITQNALKINQSGTDYKPGLTKSIPTRYIEKDDRLFYWWDFEHPLTQEAVDIYKKYGLIAKATDGIDIPKH